MDFNRNADNVCHGQNNHKLWNHSSPHVHMSTHVEPTDILCRTAPDRAEPARRGHMHHNPQVYSRGDWSLMVLSSEYNVPCHGCKAVNVKGLVFDLLSFCLPLPPLLLYGPQICHWAQEKVANQHLPLSHSMLVSFNNGTVSCGGASHDVESLSMLPSLMC